MKKRATARRKTMQKARTQAALNALKMVLAFNPNVEVRASAYHDPAQMCSAMAHSPAMLLNGKQLREIMRAAREGVRS